WHLGIAHAAPYAAPQFLPQPRFYGGECHPDAAVIQPVRGDLLYAAVSAIHSGLSGIHSGSADSTAGDHADIRDFTFGVGVAAVWNQAHGCVRRGIDRNGLSVYVAGLSGRYQLLPLGADWTGDAGQRHR